MRLSEFMELLDPDLENENFERAEAIDQTNNGLYARHYCIKWSNWLPTEDISVALDAYESDGWRAFSAFVWEALSKRIRPGDVVLARRRIMSHGGRTRTLVQERSRGRVMEVAPDYIDIWFPKEQKLLTWGIHPYENENQLSLGDLPTDLGWEMGHPDFFYDYGLDKEEVLEAVDRLEDYLKDGSDFFSWFVETYRAKTKTKTVYRKMPFRTAILHSEYVVSRTPDTLIALRDADTGDLLGISIEPLEEHFEQHLD